MERYLTRGGVIRRLEEFQSKSKLEEVLVKVLLRWFKEKEMADFAIDPWSGLDTHLVLAWNYFVQDSEAEDLREAFRAATSSTTLPSLFDIDGDLNLLHETTNAIIRVACSLLETDIDDDRTRLDTRLREIFYAGYHTLRIKAALFEGEVLRKGLSRIIDERLDVGADDISLPAVIVRISDKVKIHVIRTEEHVLVRFVCEAEEDGEGKEEDRVIEYKLICGERPSISFRRANCGHDDAGRLLRHIRKTWPKDEEGQRKLLQ